MPGQNQKYSLKIPYLTQAEVRRLDKKAKRFLPELLLIENASRGASRVILSRFKFKTCVVVAGKGNNGADALASCRHLMNAGKKAKVFIAAARSDVNTQVKFELSVLQKVFRVTPVYLGSSASLRKLKQALKKTEVVIDGIFGINFHLPLHPFYRNIFEIINQAEARVVSLDIPSGLSADSREVDTAVKADLTITFVTPKRTLLYPTTKSYWGAVVVVDIGIGYEFLKKL